MRRILLGLLFALALPAVAYCQSTPSGDPEIVAVDTVRNLLTLKDHDRLTLVQVQPGADVTINGSKAPFDTLAPKMTVKVTLTDTGVAQTVSANDASAATEQPSSIPPALQERLDRVRAAQAAMASQAEPSTPFGSVSPGSTTQPPASQTPPPDQMPTPGQMPPAGQTELPAADFIAKLANSRWRWPDATKKTPANAWMRLRSDMKVRAGWHPIRDLGSWKVLDDSSVQAKVPTVADPLILKFNADFTVATDQNNVTYQRLPK
jgi:hypothetical protein